MLPLNLRKALLLLPLCTLAGCGGGGGGSDGPPPPPPNNAPVLTTTTFAATEDTAFAGQLAATDAESQPLTFARVTDALHGTVTVSTTGAVGYTPVANYSGADTFSVRVTDSVGGTVTGTVTINVAAVNDLPVFTAPTLTTNEDVALNSQLSTSATDVDGTPLTFAVAAAPAHGALTVSAGGAAVYTPAANYNGTDSFSVSINDGAGGTATGAMTITIAAVNDEPVLTTTQVSVAEDGVLISQLAATDIDNPTVVYQLGNGAGGPGHGQASISPTGLLTYTPDANFNGADTLMVGMADSATTLTLRPLAITVNSVNDAPSASEDLLRVPADAPVVTLPLLTNDSDVDGDPVTITILSQPGGGTLAVNASNEVGFTRDNQFNGPIHFRYRITDSAGLTSEAEVRAVIGDFAGIYYLTDETNVGQAELHWFDGLRVYRPGADLEAGEQVSSFAMSGDGQTVAYVVENANVSRVFITRPNASDSRLIFTSAAKSGSTYRATIELNRNGNYLMVADPFAAGGIAHYIVRTADGLPTRIAGIVQFGYNFAFSPVNDDFYLQAQVGGSPPPMSGTGFLTLFRGNSASAGTISQVGITYPTPSLGGGSGFNLAITSDGRYVFHEEVLYSPTGSSVLVYDSLSGSPDQPVYRRPVAGEIGMWNGFALSNDGSRVCFMFREPGSGSFGPGRIVAGSPAAPSSAAPITPVFNSIYQCRFGSDNHTAFFFATTVAEPRDQVYAVDTAAPGTPTVVSRPLVSGESFENWWVARTAPRHVFGTRGIGPQVSWYSVSLDAPGTFIPFATNVFDDGSLRGQLDRQGFMLGYSKRFSPGSGLRRLTLLSTQSANYSMSLTRADSATGLVQFEWAP